MSVQLSSLQVKSLAKNLRNTMTYGRISELLQEVVTNPDLVTQLNSAIGKKSDKPIKQSSSNALIGAACGFENFESALNSASVKKLTTIEDDAALVERLNAWSPPKNRMVYMEQHLAIFMRTFKSLSEHQSVQLLLSDYFLFFDADYMYFKTNQDAVVDRGQTVGLVKVRTFDDGRFYAELNPTVFRVRSQWVVVPVSSSLPDNSYYLLNTVNNLGGFLECAAGIFFDASYIGGFWFRTETEYAPTFKKLKQLVSNDPMINPFLVDEGINDDTVFSILSYGIHELSDSVVFYGQWHNDVFLMLAAGTVEMIDDDEFLFSRTVQLSPDEYQALEGAGVLVGKEEVDEEFDPNHVTWEIQYTLKLINPHEVEVSVNQEPDLYRGGMLCPAYKKWPSGGLYSPRAAQVIWSDFEYVLHMIEREWTVENKAEVISKVAMLTVNRANS